MSDRDFLQGFAIALADLNRIYDQPTMVREIVEGNGLTLRDFSRAHVRTYDLLELRKCLG